VEFGMSRQQALSVLMLIVFGVVLVVVFGSLAASSGQAEAIKPATVQSSTPTRTTTIFSGVDPSAPVTRPAAVSSAPPAAASPSIKHVPLDGQDLADAMNLRMWKFHFTLPRGEYTNHVWLERWHSGSDGPDVQLLSQMSDTWAENDLVVELPTGSQAQPFTRIGASMSRRSDVPPIKQATGLEVLESEPLKVGDDVYLATLTIDADGRPTGGRRNVQGQHEQTIYLKTHFVPGFLVQFEPPPGSAPKAPAGQTPGAAPAPSPGPAPSTAPAQPPGGAAAPATNPGDVAPLLVDPASKLK
jgi:hypothetical protein